MTALKNISGISFGKLSVVERAGSTKRGDVKWLCKCACGNGIIVIGYNLRNGHTESCGCVRADRARIANVTHGHCLRLKRTAEYRTWTNMKSRCENPNIPRYVDYGGRGISVCSSWRDSFEQFFTDMGPKPSGKHSIDRIDVNGNYCKENCRWATASVQNKNKRKG